jgi:geranylgeranyl reductase family protein
LRQRWDILVAGGSVAGLLAAREAARLGAEVLVLEEDMEIGTPEKCGGLVSMAGLRELEVAPPREIVRVSVDRAIFHSPGGLQLAIDASRQSVVVLERRRFDRFLAEQAFSLGATINTGERVVGYEQSGELVKVATNRGVYTASLLIDARGGHGMLEVKREGVLQSAQYEIMADWIKPSTVEVFIDQEKTPGFFSWVIPLGEHIARIGAAGRGVNGFRLLDEWVRIRGGSVVKKIAAPLVVNGPLDSFLDGRRIIVGDAAGQSKPTTAGGIYTSGYGGYAAGRQAGLFIRDADPSHLARYEEIWRARFGDEFRLTKLARRLFECMDNEAIDRLFSVLERESLEALAENMFAFDRHSEAVRSLLKPRVLATLGTKMTSEMARVALQLMKLAVKG